MSVEEKEGKKKRDQHELSEAQLSIDLRIIGDFDELPIYQRGQVLRMELRRPKPGTENVDQLDATVESFAVVYR